MKSNLLKFPFLLGLFGVATASIAQQATPEQRGAYPLSKDMATMHLRASIGSFKLLDGTGRVEVSFTGSLLVSQLTGGKIQLIGKFEKQYDDRGRQLYYGKGTAIFSGKWRGVQWFGKDMKLVWYGTGKARLAGEYDKNLKTGELWYDDPKKITNWPAQGTFDYSLPMPVSQPNAPRPKRAN